MINRGNTIRDVARTAGVSISTVSKVFNNNGRIAEATRQHVLKTAADLHFQPNALIRSLRGGRTHTIGVFTWNIKEDPTRDVTMQLSRGLAEGIYSAQYDMLTYSHLDGRRPAVMASVFLDGRIDGVVVGPGDIDARGLEALVAAGFPTVVLYRRDVPDGVGYVALDNIGGMEQAVGHLYDLGHRRIAYYIPDYTYDYDERAKGYRQALTARGIAPDPRLCYIASDRQIPTFAHACDQYLALDEPPTALIAGDDYLAFMMSAELRRRAIAVPEMFSVIGFDDSVSAAEAPGLTTLRQPAQEIGQLAAGYVKEIIDGRPGNDCRKIVPVELIVRGSTAPAPTV